jgi:hypothetical protein
MRGSRSASAVQSQIVFRAGLALATLAAMLRLWHIGHGLPDFAEEAFVFRKALDLWSSGDLNPHSFVYPSLVIYLHLFLQHLYYVALSFAQPSDYLLSVLIDPTQPVILARTLGVVADLVTLGMVGRIAGGYGAVSAIIAMALVAVAPTMITTSRLLYTDSIMCALSVCAVERMLAYEQRGGWKRILTAAILVGLAAGAKYPAVLLCVPLGIATWRREPTRRVLRTWGILAGCAAAAFLITTPYLVVSWGEFTRDAVHLQDITRGGGLGKLEGHGLSYYVMGLSRNLGWICTGGMAVSLILAWRLPGRSSLQLLWTAWLVLFTAVAFIPVEADRYLVPLIGLGAVLAAIGVAQVDQLLRSAPRRLVWTSVGIIVLAQPAWSGMVAAAMGRATTEGEARKWCEVHLGEDELILSEIGGPRLITHSSRAQVMAGPVFGSASPRLRSAFASKKASFLVWLPLIVSGYGSVTLPDADQSELAVYPHVVDWNAAVYDVRLLKGVDYVVTTGAVRGRFESDPDRFPEQHRFYAFLDGFADRVAHFESGHGVEGASVSVYRISDRAKAVIDRSGTLDSLWWTRTIPRKFKDQANRILAGYERSPDSVPGLPLWAQGLRSAYAERYGNFVNDLAENLAALKRYEESERLGLTALTILPEDEWALPVYLVAARALDRQVRAGAA